MSSFALATYLTQTRKIGSWYTDSAFFVWSSILWLVRETYFAHGSEAGVFVFSVEYGRVTAWLSFRVVLTLE